MTIGQSTRQADPDPKSFVQQRFYVCVGLLTKAQIIQLIPGRIKEHTFQEITQIEAKAADRL